MSAGIMTMGTSMDPELDGDKPFVPLPRDPDTFELFGDEPGEAPESVPSPDEGKECVAGGER